MSTSSGKVGGDNDHVDGDGDHPLDEHEEDGHISEGDETGSGGLFVDGGNAAETQSAEAESKRFELKKVEIKDGDEERARGIRAAYPVDLVGRAKAMRRMGLFNWPRTVPKQVGGMNIIVVLPVDENRTYGFGVLFGNDPMEGRPHIDTFRGRFVDHVGRIVDDRYSMVELLYALAAGGLENISLDSTRSAFKEWAMQVQCNDLIEKFPARIPEWDGIKRLETALIELFETFDSAQNRQFGEYFWLSLYNRIINPGCSAPMVLSLFGVQFAGKSEFSKQICRVLLDSPTADAVQLDLDGDKLEFLREMTGMSLVANVGEMTGFTRGDLNKTKAFITKTGDNLHYKYEGHFEQQRQWITILDGNDYDGLQRDETGNRRFYPMFVGQLPDLNGQPNWRRDISLDYTDFGATLWQIMAEAALWFEEKGQDGYKHVVIGCSKMVMAFSDSERSRDRGTIKDESLDTFLIPGLKICNVKEVQRTKNKGVWIATHEIVAKISVVSRNRCDVKMNHLPPKMAMLGGESVLIDNMKGYLFRMVKTKQELLEHLRRSPDGDDDAGEDRDVDGDDAPRHDEGF